MALWAFAVAAAASEAQDFVNQMVEATKALNYDGLFVYQRDSQLNAMRIIHKAATGSDAESERLVSLSGPAREVVRDGAKVKCIFSDDKEVMVEKRQPRDFYALGLSEPVAKLADLYAFKTEGMERVAGRQTHLVGIIPRGADRYGYRLWIDADSKLLLKSAILSREGRVLEQVQFVQIEINGNIPDALLQAGLEGTGFTWYTSETEPADARAQPGQEWDVRWLPSGFEMRNSQVQHLATSDGPVKHVVYSDGLAMVSVFVEKVMHKVHPFQGYSSLGAVNAFSRVADSYQVTVVGELPEPVVRHIATSVAFHGR
ncbi:MAG: MucB/RseB C-terminal domain-containing protein [Gammaproteobacteria bacterium]|nr:MucB/RseB C-terminal domain-containing protein [Gammaproteobacteria bacterium]